MAGPCGFLEVKGKVLQGSGALLGDHVRLQGSLEEQCGCPGFNGSDQWGGYWAAQSSSGGLPGGFGLVDGTVCGDSVGARASVVWLPRSQEVTVRGNPGFSQGRTPKPLDPPSPSSPRGHPWAPPPAAVTMVMVSMVTVAPVGPPPFPGEAWRRGGTDGPGRSLPTAGERRNAATAAAHLRRAAGLAAAPRRHAGD